MKIYYKKDIAKIRDLSIQYNSNLVISDICEKKDNESKNDIPLLSINKDGFCGDFLKAGEICPALSLRAAAYLADMISLHLDNVWWKANIKYPKILWVNDYDSRELSYSSINWYGVSRAAENVVKYHIDACNGFWLSFDDIVYLIEKEQPKVLIIGDMANLVTKNAAQSIKYEMNTLFYLAKRFDLVAVPFLNNNGNDAAIVANEFVNNANVSFIANCGNDKDFLTKEECKTEYSCYF